jgi:hypothetical protein
MYSIVIWNTLRPFGIYLWPFGNLVAIWYILPHFGTFNKEKSGNPDTRRE